MTYDALIVGGGPTGLSAALVLGRCRRRVLVCQFGPPRNAASSKLSAFLTREGISPQEFLQIARAELSAYPSVEVIEAEVADNRRDGSEFEIDLADGRQFRGHKLLLATGLVDVLPDLAGLDRFWGTSAFICPICDGWEVRDQPLAVYGRGKQALELAKALTAWSPDVALCTDGASDLSSRDCYLLDQCDIPVIERSISRLEGTGKQLERICFAEGDFLARRALFLAMPQRQRSDLPERLGCKLESGGAVAGREYQKTQIPGLFVAGNASRGLQLVILAAAEGARAAYAINEELQEREIALRQGTSGERRRGNVGDSAKC